MGRLLRFVVELALRLAGWLGYDRVLPALTATPTVPTAGDAVRHADDPLEPGSGRLGPYRTPAMPPALLAPGAFAAPVAPYRYTVDHRVRDEPTITAPPLPTGVDVGALLQSTWKKRRPDCQSCGLSYRVVDARGRNTGYRHCSACGKERYLRGEAFRVEPPLVRGKGRLSIG